MVFLVPIITFYGLLLVSLCAGLVDFAGSFISRRRHRWILVASLLADLIGSWVGYQVLLGMAQGANWFAVVGLAPIASGGVSLVRWFLLKV